jgi:membrane dipeptidase
LTYAVDGSLMGGGDPAPGTRSNLARDPKPGEMYQVHLKNEDDYDAMFASTPRLRRVLNYSDIDAARQEGRAAIIQDAEGADFLEKGHLDRLEEAYKRGLRKLQLVHYAVNDITDYQIGPADHRGLSPFGVDVVKACNRLRIVIDVAHVTFDGVKGVAKASSKPILLSHTSLLGSKAQGTYHAETFRGGLPTMQARQITPDHAKAVAATGGVVGLWSLFPSAEKYVQGVREMVDVVGIDHVGIGLDASVLGVNTIWPDETEGLMYSLVGEMLKQGFTPDECGKIAGGNACRVFKACL